MPNGLNPLIGGIVLIGVTLTMAVLVGGWLTSVSESKSSFIVNKTRTQLTCQYAGIHVSNVTYECSSPSCFSGVPYKINATIENTGSSAVQLSGLYLTLDNGVSYLIPGNETTLSAGLTETRDFNSILIITDPDMPAETMDIRYSYINDSNTAALWHFNEISGTSAADSATANTGTLQNGTTSCQGSAGQCPQWNTSGKFIGAVSFDGINDYINFGNDSSLAGSRFTLEFWLKKHSTDTIQTPIGKRNATNNGGWYFDSPTGTNNIRFAMGNGTTMVDVVSTSASYPTTDWGHIAATFNGTMARIYLNGVEIGNGSLSNYQAGNGNLTIGVLGTSNVNWFNGTVDEVRISNISRNFTTNLTFNISHTNLKSVSVFNHTNQIYNINTSGNAFSGSLNASTSTDYRVEATDTSNRIIRKYHPYRTEGRCAATSTLDTVRVSTTNCPEIEDVYQGRDVFFANCPS